MRKLFVAVVLSLSSFAVAAEPELKPAQEEAKEKFDTELEGALKTLNEKCGTKLKTAKSDYENFSTELWSGRSHYSYCPDAISAVAAMCAERPAYAKAIGKKLTAVSCLFTGVKPAEKNDGSNAFTLRNMSFENGTFTVHLHPDLANIGDNAKATFEKALN